MGKDAAAASVVPIHANLTQLIRQVQSGRLAYIKVSDCARPHHHATEISGGVAAGLVFSIGCGGGLGVWLSLQEKLEVNRKTLQRHSCSLFDVAAAAEVASRGTDGGNALSQRAAERQCGSDLANGIGERDVVSVQEENLATGTLALSSSGATAQRTIVRFVKLPLVEKIPPYTTWIFLDKYGAVA
jgi:[histone H3]-lysine27 N-trimethyltransferase EZH2